LEVDGEKVYEEVEAGEEAEDEEAGGPDCTLEANSWRDYRRGVSALL
jgi:hypothetical protein